MTPAETGDELAALVLSEIDSQQDEIGKQIVYARVLRALQSHTLYRPPKPVEQTAEPMGEREAAHFECSSIPFGKYDGSPVGSVPIEYLCRLCDPSPFMRDLKRYLASVEAKRRIEEGD